MKGDIVSLEELKTRLSLNRVIVLLDPNWSNHGLAKDISVDIVEFILNGGIIVTSLNGVYLLSLYPRSYEIYEVRECMEYYVEDFMKFNLSGYDVYKYHMICISSPFAHKENSFLYVIRIGRGAIVLTSINIVWVYGDTENPSYLSYLRYCIDKALEIRAEHSNEMLIDKKIIVTGVLATLVSLTTTSSYSVHRKNGKIKSAVFLWSRIRYEDVLENPVRRRILEVLEKEGVDTFNSLWRKLGIGKATLSWHLHILKQYGFIDTIKTPKALLIYVPRTSNTHKIFEYLRNTFEDFCNIVKEYIMFGDTTKYVKQYSATTLSDLTRFTAKFIDEVKEFCGE